MRVEFFMPQEGLPTQPASGCPVTVNFGRCVGVIVSSRPDPDRHGWLVTAAIDDDYVEDVMDERGWLNQGPGEVSIGFTP